MTNPTRTRAEIQAEIEKLQEEQNEAWPQTGDTAYVKGIVAGFDYGLNGRLLADIHVDGHEDNTMTPYLTSLIPAADLIPREEHEAALFAANTRTDKVVAHLNARDAIRYLVKEYALDAPGEPRSYLHYHDGLEYSVTVERVDHIRDATKKVEHTDAEPVGALIRELNENWNQIAQTKDKWTNSHRAITDILEKINRHPAPPQGTAVAPQGVVEEMRSGIKYMALNGRCKAVSDQLFTALSRITELPEPSEVYSEWARRNVLNHGWTENELKHIVAALLAKVEAAHD